MKNFQNTVLFCTVGGSHVPIVRAIESAQPRFVCFFCTDRDPATNNPGSSTQITGKGMVIKRNQRDEKPSLPNIPDQLGLAADQFETHVIPADDLDGAISAMHAAITKMSGKFRGAKLIADYTGGTKTMSAALVCAALEREEMELRLVTGPRGNLKQVRQGTEQPVVASMVGSRLNKRIKLSLDCWSRYAYQQALSELSTISPVAANAPFREKLDVVRLLSDAFARRDAFDHGGAFGLLQDYGGPIGKVWPNMLRDLRLLIDDQSSLRTPMRILDLWRNAERRAVQGRFDDAVARAYRLIEWTAQWQLRSKCEIQTADVPLDKMPQLISVKPAADGKIKLGLWHSWQLAAHHLGEPLASLVNGSAGRKLRDLLEIRNQSILAHGDKPVAKDDWEQMRQWMEGDFFPVFDKLAGEVGLKKKPGQLPRELSDGLLENLQP